MSSIDRTTFGNQPSMKDIIALARAAKLKVKR